MKAAVMRYGLHERYEQWIQPAMIGCDVARLRAKFSGEVEVLRTDRQGRVPNENAPGYQKLPLEFDGGSSGIQRELVLNL